MTNIVRTFCDDIECNICTAATLLTYCIVLPPRNCPFHLHSCLTLESESIFNILCFFPAPDFILTFLQRFKYFEKRWRVGYTRARAPQCRRTILQLARSGGQMAPRPSGARQSASNPTSPCKMANQVRSTSRTSSRRASSRSRLLRAI